MIEQNTSYCDFRRLNQLLKIKVMTEKNADVIKSDAVLQAIIEEAEGKTCEELLGYLRSILNSFSLDLEDIQQREYTLTDKHCAALSVLCKAMDAKDESFKEISLNVLPKLLEPFKDAEGNVGDTMAIKTALFNTYTNALSGLSNALGVAEANLTYVDDDIDLGIMQAIDYLTSYFESCSDAIGYAEVAYAEPETMIELDTATTVVQALDGMEGFLDGSVDKSNLTHNQKVVTSLLYAMDIRLSALAGNEGFVDTAKEWINKILAWIRKGINTVKGWFTRDKASTDLKKLEGVKNVAQTLTPAITKAEGSDEPIPKSLFDQVISLMKANDVSSDHLASLNSAKDVGQFSIAIRKVIESRIQEAIKDTQHRSQQLTLMDKIDNEVKSLQSKANGGSLTEEELKDLKEKVGKLKEEFTGIEAAIKEESKEVYFLESSAKFIFASARGAYYIKKLKEPPKPIEAYTSDADVKKFIETLEQENERIERVNQKDKETRGL